MKNEDEKSDKIKSLNKWRMITLKFEATRLKEKIEQPYFQFFLLKMQRDYSGEYLRRENAKLREQLYVASTLLDELSSEVLTSKQQGDSKMGFLAVLEGRLKKVEDELRELKEKEQEKQKKEEEKKRNEDRKDGYLEGDVHFCVPYGGMEDDNYYNSPFKREDSELAYVPGYIDDSMYEVEELPDDEDEESDDDDESEEEKVKPKPKRAKRAGKAGVKKDAKKPILRKKKLILPEQTPVSQEGTFKMEPASQDSQVSFTID